VKGCADHYSQSIQRASDFGILMCAVAKSRRQYPGEVILTAVRWYLRYPLAYEHVSELLTDEDSQSMPAASGARCKRMPRS
jgi:hypothetical protein